MEREVIWVPWDAPGIEHLRLAEDEQGIEVDSIVVGIDSGRPYRVSYRVRCDRGWRVRAVTLHLLDRQGAGCALVSDGEGHWSTPEGQDISALTGAVDVDISVTPFTNTLPIRRLVLGPGQSADVTVVYVAVPALRVERARQRYTCLSAHADGGRYRYESLTTGFTADLVVDHDGLVVAYPGLFRRVWPVSSPVPQGTGRDASAR